MPRDRRSLIVESISLAVWWSRRVRMGFVLACAGLWLMRRLDGSTVSLCKRYAEMRWGTTVVGEIAYVMCMKNTIPRQCMQEAGRQKIAARFSSSQANRRALVPGGARSLAGSPLRGSKPLLACAPACAQAFTGSLLCSSNSLFTPASVPSAGPISAVQPTTSPKNKAPPACAGGALFFVRLVEAAGIEPASASTLQTVLHT